MFQFTVTSCTCPGKPFCDDGVVFGGILLSFLIPKVMFLISHCAGDCPTPVDTSEWATCLELDADHPVPAFLFPLSWMHLQGTDHSRQTQFFISYWPNTQHQFLLPFSKVPYFFDFMWTGLLLSWQTPSHPCNPLKTPTFFGSLFRKGVQKLLAPLPPFPTDHPVWFIVCVDVIALGGKGLASIDAKKKSFLLTAHALKMKRPVLSSHVFTTAGAFLHPSRAILYFLQLNNKGYRTRLSRIYDTVVTQIHM